MLTSIVFGIGRFYAADFVLSAWDRVGSTLASRKEYYGLKSIHLMLMRLWVLTVSTWKFLRSITLR